MEGHSQRLADGREIQQLLLNIAAICRADTFRPTVPYPPSPTATAITMRDRERLLDPAWRADTPGAEELFAALAGAIAHNLLAVDLDYSVKENRWMVLNVNRLLCPRFGLASGSVASGSAPSRRSALGCSASVRRKMR